MIVEEGKFWKCIDAAESDNALDFLKKKKRLEIIRHVAEKYNSEKAVSEVFDRATHKLVKMLSNNPEHSQDTDFGDAVKLSFVHALICKHIVDKAPARLKGKEIGNMRVESLIFLLVDNSRENAIRMDDKELLLAFCLLRDVVMGVRNKAVNQLNIAVNCLNNIDGSIEKTEKEKIRQLWIDDPELADKVENSEKPKVIFDQTELRQLIFENTDQHIGRIVYDTFLSLVKKLLVDSDAVFNKTYIISGGLTLFLTCSMSYVKSLAGRKFPSIVLEQSMDEIDEKTENDHSFSINLWRYKIMLLSFRFLSDSHRRLLYMSNAEGLEDAEIAQLAGVANVEISRARSRLKDFCISFIYFLNKLCRQKIDRLYLNDQTLNRFFKWENIGKLNVEGLEINIKLGNKFDKLECFNLWKIIAARFNALKERDKRAINLGVAHKMNATQIAKKLVVDEREIVITVSEFCEFLEKNQSLEANLVKINIKSS